MTQTADAPPLDFESFKKELNFSKEDIYRELYQQNGHHIRIKKEAVAIRGLRTIIESTLTLATSSGFHAMSLRDLCAHSGFSIGGIYAYIKNKEDLLHLIQSYGFLLTRKTLDTRTRDLPPGPVKLHTAIRVHLFLSELMPTWFSFSFMEARNLPDLEKQRTVRLSGQIEDLFMDILQEGMAQKLFRQADARLLAALTKAMMQDWYLRHSRYRRQGIDVGTYAQQVYDILLHYLDPVSGEIH
jgi:AcrR family transcriptional regulator